MTGTAGKSPALRELDKSDYDVRTLDDEIRVDRLCVELLRHLYQELTSHGGMPPQRAGELCQGADYFLREFVIADRRDNLFAVSACRIRQFAGHWYIIRTPEPNLKELQVILAGTEEFYRYLARQGLLAAKTAEEIAGQCRETDFYRSRIDDFWAIEGDGYESWRRACPLPPAAG